MRRDASRGVLFDLDGTLADTAPDMALALNRVLEMRQREALPLEAIRPYVSHGGQALIELGFGVCPEDAAFPELRRDFLDSYRLHLSTHTQLFPQVDEMLGALEAQGIPWGIVTNKPGWLTDPLMQRLGMDRRAACIISGDTTAHAKPHPEPIVHACRLMQRAPQDCWYIGDAERDIEAGRAAGARTLVALFGYFRPADQPSVWGADGMIESPMQVLDWIGGA
jgi:phosphoglycolate phosphatase